MDVKKEILREHSKAQCDKIVHWIGDDKKRFQELFELFLHGDYRITQRAAWPLSNCVISHPRLLKANYVKLIANLEKDDLHDAVKRNTLRLLQQVNIPQKIEGTVMEACFKYLASQHEAVAIKAFSLGVLGKLAKKYPEIIPEIKLIIEEQLPHQGAAFRSRARNFLKTFPSG